MRASSSITAASGCATSALPPLSGSPATRARGGTLLLEHLGRWAGNVAELRAAVERAMILA